MKIIFFTRSLPSHVSHELQLQGHTVLESLSVSETLSLAEQQSGAAIIINYDVEPQAATVIQRHYPTLTLNQSATISNVLWELSNVAGETIH